MTRQLLWRGMLAGILGALLATLFARGFAEPQIDLAIGYEEDHAAHGPLPDYPAPDHPAPDHAGMAMASAPLAHPHPADEEELVSRDTQKGAGLVTALALYGAAVGASSRWSSHTAMAGWAISARAASHCFWRR